MEPGGGVRAEGVVVDKGEGGEGFDGGGVGVEVGMLGLRRVGLFECLARMRRYGAWEW